MYPKALYQFVTIGLNHSCSICFNIFYSTKKCSLIDLGKQEIEKEEIEKEEIEKEEIEKEEIDKEEIKKEQIEEEEIEKKHSEKCAKNID